MLKATEGHRLKAIEAADATAISRQRAMARATCELTFCSVGRRDIPPVAAFKLHCPSIVSTAA